MSGSPTSPTPPPAGGWTGTPAVPPSDAGRRRRAAVVVGGLAGLGVVALAIYGPIPQDVAYHGFADDRSWGGVSNLLDVVSNLPFLVVALIRFAPLRAWQREARPPRWARRGAWALWVGIAGTAVGSAVYHLDPRNVTLVYDRLPMALAFGGFFALLLGDRFGDVVGRRALWPSLGFAVGSVAAWAATLGAPGADDLRPYAVAQYLPALTGVVCLLLLPPPPAPRRWLLMALVAYGVAKGLEVLDAPVFRATGGVVSGHTLKHVAAAVAGWALLRWTTILWRPTSG